MFDSQPCLVCLVLHKDKIKCLVFIDESTFPIKWVCFYDLIRKQLFTFQFLLVICFEKKPKQNK